MKKWLLKKLERYERKSLKSSLDYWIEERKKVLNRLEFCDIAIDTYNKKLKELGD